MIYTQEQAATLLALVGRVLKVRIQHEIFIKYDSDEDKTRYIAAKSEDALKPTYSWEVEKHHYKLVKAEKTGRPLEQFISWYLPISDVYAVTADPEEFVELAEVLNKAPDSVFEAWLQWAYEDYCNTEYPTIFECMDWLLSTDFPIAK